MFSVELEAQRQGHSDEGTATGAQRRGHNDKGTTHGYNRTVFVIPESLGNRPLSWEYLKTGDPETGTLGSVSELDPETRTLGSVSELDPETGTLGSTLDGDDTLSRDLERVSVGSLGKWSWDIHSIILDLSTVNFTDTMAIKTLRNICHDFREIEVDVYLAGCQPCVVEELERGLFFSKMLTKAHLFASVHDAVLHCGDHRGSPRPPHHCDRDIGCSTKL
ncbi:solute carrier family 26 member 6-like [Huso huso]|uniref:Solute carrier family 26 member 6-like n=1 Tax=Huso huso TaxID=61971 RepID=A0ABR0ZL17_HUSHU